MARGQTDGPADARPPRRCAPARRRPSSLPHEAALPVPTPPAGPRPGFAKRSAAVLAFLLCAGQVTALPVNSPRTKGDIEVMKCIVEVISDSLSKPSPMPVSQECLEILRGDERILSILRHQNLLRELQDLALQGTKERAQQQKKHSSFEEELSEVVGNHSDKAKRKDVMEEASPKDAMERGGDGKEENAEATEEARPQALPEPRQGSVTSGSKRAPSEEEEEQEAPNTQLPASLPSQEHPSPAQSLEDGQKGTGAEQGQPEKREKEEEKEEDEEAGDAGEKAVPGGEDPTAVLNSHQDLSDKEIQKGDSWSEALDVDGAGKTGTEEARPTEGKGEQEQEEEEMAGVPQGPFRGGKSRELEQEEERLSREREDAERWSRMDQLAKELAAEKRLEGEDQEDDPDRSMKLSFQAPAYDFRGSGPQLRRGWRPSSREDSIEAGLPLQAHGFREEKKEEEGSANRRAEDQELESLSAIEAELEKAAHQLQALRRG
ncbi:chromogranin-A [Heterocephalus glaber]|uniref:Chromogranin-A n=1 Tax=Heterocephalus glaber TaxID=10181 RepID=A0A0P6IXQ1_HETGA|nr:chromogranin-A [Heterocephalus glaber]